MGFLKGREKNKDNVEKSYVEEVEVKEPSIERNTEVSENLPISVELQEEDFDEFKKMFTEGIVEVKSIMQFVWDRMPDSTKYVDNKAKAIIEYVENINE